MKFSIFLILFTHDQNTFFCCHDQRECYSFFLTTDKNTKRIMMHLIHCAGKKALLEQNVILRLREILFKYTSGRIVIEAIVTLIIEKDMKTM